MRVLATPHEPPRVLVVDDEASILTFANRVLTNAGYEVVVAADGPQALQLVEAQQRPFDLFVLDVLMPQMRGDELGRRVRQRDADAKVLYFTGFADQLFEERPCYGKTRPFSKRRSPSTAC